MAPDSPTPNSGLQITPESKSTVKAKRGRGHPRADSESSSAPEADLGLRTRRRIVDRLKQLYPRVQCALDFQNPFQLLVATILSAQCTDKRVNLVTPRLFARFPDPIGLAHAEQEELEELIRSTGFFRAKSRNLIGMARTVVESHGGVVPTDLESLTKLPGVGRKTANVVLGTAHGIASGVVVDTHVKRLSRRMGLTTKADPVRIERELMRIVPRGQWIDFSHRMITHGRAICRAARPSCDDCGLSNLCPRVGVTATRPSRGPSR